MSWLREEREPYLLGLLRVAFAILLLIQTLRRWQELTRWGYFGDAFHMPLWPEAWVPSHAGYGALLALAALGCVLSLLGFWARATLAASALIGLFCFFCDRLQYHNNRYELLLLALLVAVTPCDRSWLPFRARLAGEAPRWAARLVAAQLSTVYLASSLGKLFDPDWRGGVVMLLRFSRAAPRVPSLLGALISEPWFAHSASLVAIATELFLALGLWFRRSRVAALWLGVMFHVGIEISARVELFSYTMLCGYLVFVTPELRERRVSWRPGTRLARLVEGLDLLARFRHEQPSQQRELLLVVDRAGKEHAGLAAWRELARAFPPLFPLWLPLYLATRRRRARA